MGMVTHGASGMSMVKNPCQCFGESIGNVDTGRNGNQNDEAACTPLLCSKVLDIDVTGPWCRLTGIDNEDGSGVVFINGSRIELWEAQIM